MRREKQNLRNAQNSRVRARGPAQFSVDNDDDPLTEVGEELDLSLFDEMEAEDRRHDPLRFPH